MFCETIHFESGAAESCDWEHVSIEKNRKEVACKRFSKGTSARCEQTDKDAPSPLMLALRDSTLERRKDHGIRMTALRSEGTGTTTWVFWTGAGALVTGGDACDEPVWLGEVTGFPSFGLRCVWGDGGALAVWKTTAVLHLVDLRKHGVARLGQHALVLGSGLADASRVIPTDTPPPNGSAPPPTFKLEGRRVLVSSGQAFCFSSGWKRC